MENTIRVFAYLTKKVKYKYLKSDFFVLSSNLVLATERTKSRDRFMLSRSIYVDFGLYYKSGAICSRHGIFLFGFFCQRMDIFRHFINLISDCRVQ